MSKPAPPLFLPAVPTPTTQRERAVAELFGLPAAGEVAARRPRLPIGPVGRGEVVLLTGPSGGGKSSLLRRLARRHARSAGVTWLDKLRLPRASCVDQFPGLPVPETLAHLGRCGLGEAWTYLRPPGQLSDGQRFRLRLAVALHRSRPGDLIVADEFTAGLDRLTAAVVAASVRKLTRATGVALACATCHGDVARALRPDVTLTCDFGPVTVRRSRFRAG